jgi:hypothetical protein
MTMGPVELGMKNSSADEGQQQFNNQSIKGLTQSQVNTSNIKTRDKNKTIYIIQIIIIITIIIVSK